MVVDLSLIFQRLVTVLSTTAMDLGESSFPLRRPDHMNSVGQVVTGFNSQVIMDQAKVVATG